MQTKRLRLEISKDLGFFKNHKFFCIYMIGSKVKVGEISISLETGEICYSIDYPFRGRGYATESLEQIVKYAKEKNVNPFLRIKETNSLSKRVAEKVGFSFEKLFQPNKKFGLWYLTKS